MQESAAVPPKKPHLRQAGGGGGERAQQAEDVVGRGVREHLEIVGRGLVVRGHEERHDAVEELLAGGMVREQRVPVDVVQRAVLRQGGPAT